MSGYVVTAPAVRVVVGSHAHLVEQGRPLPAGVSADDVERLSRKGMVEPVEEHPESEPDPEPDPEPSGVGQDEVPDFSGMNLDQLRTYAAEHGVDLGGATRKDDVIAVLITAV